MRNVQKESGKIIRLDAPLFPADQIGNTGQQVHDVSQTVLPGGTESPLGADGGKANRKSAEIPWDTAVRLADIRARFEAETTKLKQTSRDDYWYYFRIFAEHVELTRYTRRQLASPNGRNLLIGYLGDERTVGPFSRSVHMYGIKKVWRRGLDLPWPIERDDDDLPKIPRPKMVPGPRREDVEPWVNAARNEQNPYERAWFLMESTYGLRPANQQAHLRRRNLQFNPATGKPIGLVANGTEENFKRDSYVIAAFPQEVADAVEAWLKVHPNASPEAWLFPWRDAQGNLNPNLQATYRTIRAMRRRFEKRWNLRHLESKMMRKFVKGVLIDSRMPEPLKSFWQGHLPSRANMDAVYGVKSWEESFTAQLSYLPAGPLGVFGSVQRTGDIPAELAALWKRFHDKEIDAQDFASELKALDRRQATVTFVGP